MDGPRLFVAVDNAAVKILQKETRSKKVVKPRFTADFLGAVKREGADVSSPCEHMRKVFCAPLPTPRM